MPIAVNESKPWYRQFWPWFLIALPSTVVVAALFTVYIAFRHADDLVIDNYYKAGRAINESLGQDNTATALGLSAAITFDALSGEVLVSLTGEGDKPPTLRLLLLHPMSADLDDSLLLASLGDGRYRADLATMPQQRYYLRIEPVDDPLWRLNGELDFRQGHQARLESGHSG